MKPQQSIKIKADGFIGQHRSLTRIKTQIRQIVQPISISHSCN